MRQVVCLVAAVCLLPSFLPVAVTTEDSENRTTALPPVGDVAKAQRLPRSGAELKVNATSSNSSAADEIAGLTGVPLSGAEDKDEKSSFALQEDTASGSQDALNESRYPKTVVSHFDPDQDHSSGRLLVAVARTLVTSTASTTTATVQPTCHDGVDAEVASDLDPCPAKKKKRRLALLDTELAISDTGLDSALESKPELFQVPIGRSGRIILWSSSVTTIIFTSTTTDMDTVTVSYQCSFDGIVDCR